MNEILRKKIQIEKEAMMKKEQDSRDRPES